MCYKALWEIQRKTVSGSRSEALGLLAQLQPAGGGASWCLWLFAVPSDHGFPIWTDIFLLVFETVLRYFKTMT